MDDALSKEAFKNQLLALDKYYHIYHPYHIAMNHGQLNQEQIQAWVLNRYYYQISIPRKDAAILANCPDPAFRKKWIQRIIDHDGTEQEEGGIEAWLTLAEAVGLKREEVTSLKHVLPGVRFAVDAYVNFANQAPWQEAVCSSLTELFAPKIHQQRLDNWPENYPWIDEKGFRYFQKRLSEARRDVEHGLGFTLEHFSTYELQQRALNIVKFKCDVLWSLCDALFMTYCVSMPLYEHNIPQLADKIRLQWEQAQKKHVLLYAEGMIVLNDSAAEILQLCDGENSISAITSTLQNKYKSEDLSQDIMEFLGEAHAKGWITIG